MALTYLAGIPLLMEPLSENSTDAVSFRETIRTHIDQLHHDVKIDYLIADSALYNAETLQELSAVKWISRVPATLSLAREMIHASAAARPGSCSRVVRINRKAL